MKRIFEAVKDNPLFAGIEYKDFDKMCHCIETRTQIYKKDDTVLLSGNEVNSVGLILSGTVKIIKEDIDGSTTILTVLTKSELFGEAFACAGIKHSPVTIIATEESEVLFINYKKILNICSAACSFHSRLIENMLKIIANKNLRLTQKIEILSKRSTREKLLTFFEFHRRGNKKFTIPYNREEMARYLCVDRSAMSNELCKMRDEGLIKFSKNSFEIL